jgi:hypothetical protein
VTEPEAERTRRINEELIAYDERHAMRGAQEGLFVGEALADSSFVLAEMGVLGDGNGNDIYSGPATREESAAIAQQFTDAMAAGGFDNAEAIYREVFDRLLNTDMSRLASEGQIAVTNCALVAVEPFTVNEWNRSSPITRPRRIGDQRDDRVVSPFLERERERHRAVGVSAARRSRWPQLRGSRSGPGRTGASTCHDAYRVREPGRVSSIGRYGQLPPSKSAQLQAISLEFAGDRLPREAHPFAGAWKVFADLALRFRWAINFKQLRHEPPAPLERRRVWPTLACRIGCPGTALPRAIVETDRDQPLDSRGDAWKIVGVRGSDDSARSLGAWFPGAFVDTPSALRASVGRQTHPSITAMAAHLWTRMERSPRQGAMALLCLKPLTLELQRDPVLGDGTHDVIGRPRGNLGVDVKGHLDVCPDESGKVGDDFVGNLTGVPPHPAGIEDDRAMVALRLRGNCWR